MSRLEKIISCKWLPNPGICGFMVIGFALTMKSDILWILSDLQYIQIQRFLYLIKYAARFTSSIGKAALIWIPSIVSSDVGRYSNSGFFVSPDIFFCQHILRLQRQIPKDYILGSQWSCLWGSCLGRKFYAQARDSVVGRRGRCRTFCGGGCNTRPQYWIILDQATILTQVLQYQAAPQLLTPE